MMKRMECAMIALCLGLSAVSAFAAPKETDPKKPAAPARPPATPLQPIPAAPAKTPTSTPAPAARATPAAPASVRTFLFKSYPSVDALAKALPSGTAKPALASHLQALRAGYSELIEGVAVDNDSHLHIVLSDHSMHLYDDGRTKTPEQRIESADIEDMFHDVYPLKNPTDTLPLDFDPGRARPEGFFKAVYGGSAAEVSRNLENVDFCGVKVSFNSRNGATAALKKVSADLKGVLAQKPELKVWTEKMGGTFAWRPIAGTSLLSMHCYGVAIDLNTEKAAYWRWNKGDLRSYSRKSFPTEIIECFERHGFIWGGKWSHFDTMHFEYRPEIIDFARRTGGEPPTAAAVVEPKTAPAPTASTPAPTTPPATPAPRPPSAPPPEPGSNPRRVALLLSGHPTSPGAAFPPLLAMDKDIPSISAALKKTGFAVTEVESPTLAAALTALESFGASLGPDTEVALFYFSGHACRHEGQMFFLPKGAQVSQPGDIFAEAIPLSRVKEALKKSAAAQRIILLEAARVQFNTETGGALGNAEAMDPGFFFGFATRGAAAANRNENGGVFTQALSKHLTDPGISVTDMFSRVAKDVSEATAKPAQPQQPEATSTLTQIFYFAAPPAPPAQ